MEFAPPVYPARAGIGGWLVLLAIGQTLAPAAGLFGAYGMLLDARRYTGHLHIAEIFYAVAFASAAMAAFSMYVAITLWRHSPAFPRLFTWEICVAIAIVAFEPALIALWIGLPIARFYDQSEIALILKSTVPSIPWVAYVWKSERVANTFVPKPTASPAALNA